MFVENILGSKAKVKLVRVLSEVRTAYSLKALVDETGLSLSISHQAAEELAEEGVFLKIKGNRKERLYKFNADSSFAFVLFELFKIEKTRQRREVIPLKIWNTLEHLLTTIKHKTFLIVLFGSQARGEATLKSDIDVLIVPKGKTTLLLEQIKRIDKKLAPLFMHIDALKAAMQNKTQFYTNLQKDSIILFADKHTKESLSVVLCDFHPSFVLGKTVLEGGML